MRKLVALAACAVLIWTGCGRKKRARVVIPAVVGATETGIASWYGYPYHGRQAANGEIYDMETLTAAHRTLPFGTWVRIHNLANGKKVEVRITDRGPFVEGRIIDLSRAAARIIDLIGPGTAPVRLEVISAPAAQQVASNAFAVQVGAFQKRENAERVRLAMEQRYGGARLILRQGRPAVWRVLVGVEPTIEEASLLAERIRLDSGAELRTAFVVRLDSEPSAGESGR